MGATVLLLHRLPDGSSHYDWLLERPESGARLLTFRLSERIDDPGVCAFDAERIADHRRVYLDYEGEISAGRGTVERLARGRCKILEEGAGHLRAHVELGAVHSLLEGARIEGGLWRFHARLLGSNAYSLS